MESSQAPENESAPTDLSGGVALPWEKSATPGHGDSDTASAGPLDPETIQGELPEITELTLLQESKDYCSYRGKSDSGNSVAVHVFPRGFQGPSGDDAVGFLPGKEAAIELKCRSVIDVERCVEIEGRQVVVTEMPEGKLLSDWRAQENLAPERVRAVGRELCKAVARLHAAELPHLCLNPAAVYVDDNDEVKILGPGLGNLFYSAWREEISGRTEDDSDSKNDILDYLAPEVRKGGLAKGDHRSDIWSLGAILYDLCLGHPPKGFLFDMSSSTVAVSEDYATSLSRAMETRPGQRTDSVARLIDQLDGLEKPPPPPPIELDPPELTERVDEAAAITSTAVEASAPNPVEERKYSATDGLLARCGGPVMLGILALVLVAGGLFAVQRYLRVQDRDRPEYGDESGGVLAKLHRASELALRGMTFDALDLVREVTAVAEVNRNLLGEITQVLLKTGRYQGAILILDEYVARGESGDPGLHEVTADWALTKRHLQSFLAAVNAAETAREEKNEYLEHEALSRAHQLIPGDGEIRRKLARNSVHVYTQAVNQLAELKKENPSQKTWLYHLWVSRGSARLDLSGNHQLKSIASLRGLPLTELDLSGSGVSDLGPLTESQLEVLRLDEAPVKSLEAIAGLPLQVLTFENCALHSASLPESLAGLRVLRGDIGGDRIVRIGEPVAGLPWENELGMRFRPVGKGEVLVSVWETRARDFQKFLNEKRPGQTHLERRAGMVVTGVSCGEAEEFCEWLTARDRKRGALAYTQSYRLPTSFEWSLAAALYENPLLAPAVGPGWEQKSGSATPGHREMILETSEGIPGEFDEGSGRGPDEVGRRLSWHGFYDLKGNAREWCGDMVGEKSDHRIVRGAEGLGARTLEPVSSREFDLGFRVVLEASSPPAYGALRSLVSKGLWEEAQDMALRRAIGDAVPAVRDAGRAFLDLRHLIGGGDRAIPDSVVGVGQFEGRKYYAAHLPLSWDEASGFAEVLGGHLVTITSEGERRWIEDDFLGATPGDTFWLGAAIRPGSRSWGWVTREPWIFNRVEGKSARDTTRGLVLGPAQEEAGPEAADADPAPGASWLSDDAREAHCFIVEWEPGESTESLATSARR